MILKVENLGQIRKAEIDLKPLTLFIGPNGTNKTWTAYAAAECARILSLDSLNYSDDGPPDLELHMTTSDRQVLDRISNALHLDSPFGSYELRTDRSELSVDDEEFSVGAKLASALLGAVLGERSLELPDGAVGLWMTTQEAKQISLDSFLQFSRLDDQLLIRWTNHFGTREYSTQILHNASLGASGVRREIRDALNTLADGAAFRGVYTFPAQRDGLAILYRDISGRGDENSDYPLAIITYARLLRRLAGLASMEQASPTELANIWIDGEVSLLHGRHTAEVVDVTGIGVATRSRKKPQLKFTLPDGKDLNLSASSSLSRAMLGFGLYLKYLAKPGDLVVIDELEMNAHPEAQLAVIELITQAVNSGLKVIATTHSPYIVDHLNNLITGATLSPESQKEFAPKLATQNPQAFIDVDQVGVYEFTVEGEVRDVVDRQEKSIQWTTFSDVTNRMNALAYQLNHARQEQE